MTSLTCRQVADFLADYLSDELPRQQRDSFEAHLLHCDPCVVYLRRYQETVRLGSAAFDGDEVEVPAALVAAILGARTR